MTDTARPTPLVPEEIRASRRPGVIAAVYAGYLALGLFVATPVTRLVADATGGYARSDALLFDPGAVFLLDALTYLRRGLESFAVLAVLLGLAAAVLGLFPLAALLHALSHRGRMDLAELARAAARPFRSLTGLLGLAVLAWTFLVFLALAVLGALSPRSDSRLGPEGAALVSLGVIAVAAAVGATLGVVHDLARAAVVREGLSTWGGLRRATDALSRRTRDGLLAWSGRAACSAAILAAGALLAFRIGVESEARVRALWVVHQTVIVGLVVLRASWLAAALRLLGRAPAKNAAY